MLGGRRTQRLIDLANGLFGSDRVRVRVRSYSGSGHFWVNYIRVGFEFGLGKVQVWVIFGSTMFGLVRVKFGFGSLKGTMFESA